jgi:hypothetical protein
MPKAALPAHPNVRSWYERLAAPPAYQAHVIKVNAKRTEGIVTRGGVAHAVFGCSGAATVTTRMSPFTGNTQSRLFETFEFLNSFTDSRRSFRDRMNSGKRQDVMPPLKPF